MKRQKTLIFYLTSTLIIIIGSFLIYKVWEPDPVSKTTPNSKPTIYVSIVSHNETDDPRYGDYDNREGYLEFRESLLKMVRLIKKYDVTYSFQPDWRFLEAAIKYENGNILKNTNNKNILRYFYEDLDIEIDAHSHETNGYNYADVVYLIKKLGVEPTKIVGGFIADDKSGGNINWQKFEKPLQGNRYNFTWRFETLWGGSSQNHLDQIDLCGIHKPESEKNFFTHDENASLNHIGSCSPMPDKLLNKIDTLDPDKMYTMSVLFFEEEVRTEGEKALQRYEEILKKLKTYEQQGYIKWVNLQDMSEIWRKKYDEEPNIYTL